MGDTVGGRYQLQIPLGESATGMTWQGTDSEGGDSVAIAVLAADASEARRAEFLRIASALAQVDHPGVVRVSGSGTDEDGRAYMVMELIDGVTLDEHLRDEPGLTLGDVISKLADVLVGLGQLHDKGVVHGELGPNKLLWSDEDGSCKVIGFGLGATLDRIDPDSERPRDSSLTTSVPFLAPECLDSKATLDARTDVFGLGALLYRVVTGRPPERIPAGARGAAATPTAVTKLRPEVAAPLGRVIERAIHPDPRRRYPTAGAMRGALVHALSLAKETAQLPVAATVPAAGAEPAAPAAPTAAATPTAPATPLAAAPVTAGPLPRVPPPSKGLAGFLKRPAAATAPSPAEKDGATSDPQPDADAAAAGAKPTPRDPFGEEVSTEELRLSDVMIQPLAPPPPPATPPAPETAALAEEAGPDVGGAAAAPVALPPEPTPAPTDEPEAIEIPVPSVPPGGLIDIEPSAQLIAAGRRRLMIRWGGAGLAALAAIALGWWAWPSDAETPALPDPTSTAPRAVEAENDTAPVVEPQRDEPEVEPEPATRTIDLVGVPPGAQVRLDGTEVDPAAIELPAGDGQHVIEVRADGHRPWRHTIGADETQIEVALEPIVTRRPGDTAMRPARPTMRTPPPRMTMSSMLAIRRDPGF